MRCLYMRHPSDIRTQAMRKGNVAYNSKLNPPVPLFIFSFFFKKRESSGFSHEAALALQNCVFARSITASVRALVAGIVCDTLPSAVREMQIQNRKERTSFSFFLASPKEKKKREKERPLTQGSRSPHHIKERRLGCKTAESTRSRKRGM